MTAGADSLFITFPFCPLAMFGFLHDRLGMSSGRHTIHLGTIKDPEV